MDSASEKAKPCLNQKLVDAFNSLKDIRISQGEIWRAKAYQKIIPVLKGLNYVLSTKKQALMINGIGERMASKIEEIMTSGTISELTTYKENPKEKIIKLFCSVERVSRITAEKWYKKGYRKIEDISIDDCNSGQWLGILYHEELIQRIPRSHIVYFEKVFRKYIIEKGLDKKPYSIKIEIAGSYRRGTKDSGDIDVIVQTRKKDALEILTKCPLFVHTLASGVKKYMGIIKIKGIHRRIDLELVTPEEYPFAIVYFTGPAEFNVKMRIYCSQLGLCLNEKGIRLIKDKKDTLVKFLVVDEKDLFHQLNIKYYTPLERNLCPDIIPLCKNIREKEEEEREEEREEEE